MHCTFCIFSSWTFALSDIIHPGTGKSIITEARPTNALGQRQTNSKGREAGVSYLHPNTT